MNDGINYVSFLAIDIEEKEKQGGMIIPAPEFCFPAKARVIAENVPLNIWTEKVVTKFNAYRLIREQQWAYPEENYFTVAERKEFLVFFEEEDAIAAAKLLNIPLEPSIASEIARTEKSSEKAKPEIVKGDDEDDLPAAEM